MGLTCNFPVWPQTPPPSRAKQRWGETIVCLEAPQCPYLYSPGCPRAAPWTCTLDGSVASAGQMPPPTLPRYWGLFPSLDTWNGAIATPVCLWGPPLRSLMDSWPWLGTKCSLLLRSFYPSREAMAVGGMDIFLQVGDFWCQEKHMQIRYVLVSSGALTSGWALVISSAPLGT